MTLEIEGLAREIQEAYKIYDGIEVTFLNNGQQITRQGLFYTLSNKADLSIDGFLIFTEPEEDGLGKIAHGETVRLINFTYLQSHRKLPNLDRPKYLQLNTV